jgi:hypothetical protein
MPYTSDDNEDSLIPIITISSCLSSDGTVGTHFDIGDNVSYVNVLGALFTTLLIMSKQYLDE